MGQLSLIEISTAVQVTGTFEMIFLYSISTIKKAEITSLIESTTLSCTITESAAPN